MRVTGRECVSERERMRDRGNRRECETRGKRRARFHRPAEAGGLQESDVACGCCPSCSTPPICVIEHHQYMLLNTTNIYVIQHHQHVQVWGLGCRMCKGAGF